MQLKSHLPFFFFITKKKVNKMIFEYFSAFYRPTTRNRKVMELLEIFEFFICSRSAQFLIKTRRK